MLLQLLAGGEGLAAFHATDLVPLLLQCVALGPLVAPASGGTLVLLEVLVAGERGQARHTLDGLGLALVLAVLVGQPEVDLAVRARVRQQAQVREAVAKQHVLLAEALAAVGAEESALAGVFDHVAPQGLMPLEAPAALAALRLAGFALVFLHVRQALVHAREDALAVVALVELVLKVRGL